MITKLLGVLKGEPVALTGLVTALITVLAAVGVPKGIVAALGGLVTALLVLVRAIVMPTSKVTQAITNVAHASATAAVAAVDATTAGAVGEVLPAAAMVVHDAAETVVGNVLQDVGLAPAGAHKA